MKTIENAINDIQNVLTKTVLCAALALALVCSAKADLVINPSQPNTYTNLGILPATVAASSTSNLVSQPVTITPGAGLAVEIAVTGGYAATTSNYVVGVNFSIDGSIWPSNCPITITRPLSGTTPQRIFTNIPSWYFDGAYKARAEYVQCTDTNSISVQSLKLGREKQNFRPRGFN